MRLIAPALIYALLAGCSPEAEEADRAVAAVDTDAGADVEAATEAGTNANEAQALGGIDLPDEVAPSPKPILAGKCFDAEQIIFSCKMKSGKYASICVTGEGDERFAQYRFGPSGEEAELVWPASAKDGQLAFRSVPYSGGGEAQVSFVNGDTRYVVFSRMVRTHFVEGEPNYPAINDGIMVMRGSTPLGELLCEGGQSEHPVHYNLAETYSKPAEQMFYLDE